MENIIVIGASGHAKVVIDIIEKQRKFQIVGIVDNVRAKGETFLHYSVLGAVEDIPALVSETFAVGGVVAIGDNWGRAEVVSAIKRTVPAFKFVCAIHPASEIGREVIVGDGTVIMAGAVINSDSRIGEHCIINTHASVDHDNILGDFVSVGPNATTGGNVEIGGYSFVGLGAQIVHRIRIGEHTLVGAGSTVLDDLPSCVVAFGSPAKVRKTRSPGDRYL